MNVDEPVTPDETPALSEPSAIEILEQALFRLKSLLAPTAHEERIELEIAIALATLKRARPVDPVETEWRVRNCTCSAFEDVPMGSPSPALRAWIAARGGVEEIQAARLRAKELRSKRLTTRGPITETVRGIDPSCLGIAKKQ